METLLLILGVLLLFIFLLKIGTELAPGGRGAQKAGDIFLNEVELIFSWGLLLLAGMLFIRNTQRGVGARNQPHVDFPILKILGEDLVVFFGRR